MVVRIGFEQGPTTSRLGLWPVQWNQIGTMHGIPLVTARAVADPWCIATALSTRAKQAMLRGDPAEVETIRNSS